MGERQPEVCGAAGGGDEEREALLLLFCCCSLSCWMCAVQDVGCALFERVCHARLLWFLRCSPMRHIRAAAAVVVLRVLKEATPRLNKLLVGSTRPS